jgi:hypothetical protein
MNRQNGRIFGTSVITNDVNGQNAKQITRSSYIDMTDLSVVDFTNNEPFTVSAWLKPTGGGVYPIWFSHTREGGPDAAFMIGFNSQQNNQVIVYNPEPGMGWVTFGASTAAILNEWHKYTLTYDGTRQLLCVPA